MKAPRATDRSSHFFLLSIFLLFSGIALFPAPALAWKMEARVITLPAVAIGSTAFTTVTLQQTYPSAPLIFILPGEENTAPSSIRIRNVTATTFQVAQVEAPNGDGAQPATTVHYLAVEPGRHTMPNGTVLVAGTLSTTAFQNKLLGGTSWGSVSFSPSLSATPAVLAQVQTMANETGAVPGKASVPWLETAVRNVATTGFSLALERAEVVNGSVSVAETIAYFAMAGGSNGSFADNSGTTVTYESIISPVTITNSCTWVNFAGAYSVTPLVIASQNTRNGGDGGWLKRCGSPNIQTTRVSLKIEEDTANDSEQTHTTESAGILVFSQPFAATIIPPVANYRFDACALTTGELLDSFGSLNGTVVGGVSTADGGVICKTGTFNGLSGSYATLGNPAALQVGTGSISAWIKTSGAGNQYRGIVTKLNAFGLYLRNNRLIIHDFGSNSRRDTGVNLDDNTWHHVAVTFQSGVANGTIIYIDGTARLTTTMTVVNQLQPVIIGAGTDADSYAGNFAGSIDEVLLYNTVLPASVISSIRANHLAGKNSDGSTRSCALCTAPRAEYRFDECSWSGTAGEVTDSGVNGYHGTSFNTSVTTTARFCRSGDFTANSITDYLSLASGAANGLTNFSVSAWIKTANSGNQAILSGANNTQFNEMLMWLSSSTSFMPFVKGSSQTIAIADVADNNWHHLVWTHSAGTSCIYRDSVLQGCQGGLPATALSISSGGLLVGQEQDSLGGGFDITQDFEGHIDQLRIYPVPLTATEVTSLFTESQPGCPSCAPPITEWRFDECLWDGTSNEVIDRQGVAHGTRQGNATTLTSGKLCRAGTFDGSGDYVDMGDSLNTVLGNSNNVLPLPPGSCPRP